MLQHQTAEGLEVKLCEGQPVPCRHLTCYYNFRKNFCVMTCSPKQASFIGANGYVEGPGFEDYEGQMVEMVESVTYYANTAFVEDVYDSCKDVVIPAIGPVMTFLCGPWGAEHCDGFRMFDFQGTVTNGYAPFNINYICSSPSHSCNHSFYHNHNCSFRRW